MEAINDRDMKRAAVVLAAGHHVNIFKLASPRCVASYPDTIEVKELLEQYEAGKPLAIPLKSVMVAYGWIMGQCRELKQGAL